MVTMIGKKIEIVIKVLINVKVSSWEINSVILFIFHISILFFHIYYNSLSLWYYIENENTSSLSQRYMLVPKELSEYVASTYAKRLSHDLN